MSNPDPAAVARAAIMVLGMLAHFVFMPWLWATPEPPRRYRRHVSQFNELTPYLDSLAGEQREAIDTCILDCDILGALIFIQEYCGVGLEAAKDIHWVRYHQLRADRSTEFACTDQQYWDGVCD